MQTAVGQSRPQKTSMVLKYLSSICRARTFTRRAKANAAIGTDPHDADTDRFTTWNRVSSGRGMWALFLGFNQVLPVGVYMSKSVTKVNASIQYTGLRQTIAFDITFIKDVVGFCSTTIHLINGARFKLPLAGAKSVLCLRYFDLCLGCP